VTVLNLNRGFAENLTKQFNLLTRRVWRKLFPKSRQTERRLLQRKTA